MQKINLTYHGGSKNHGCEAIVRSTKKILNEKELVLFSFAVDQDYKYKLDEVCTLESLNIKAKNIFQKVLNKIIYNLYDKSVYYNKRLLCDDDIIFSIGGDNYSDYRYALNLVEFNNEMYKKNINCVLWGCSIEPELLKHANIIDDMKKYVLITARESITYDALIKAGITKNTKLFPDPAFVLDMQRLELPNNFIEGNTVGINVSPLIQRLEGNNNITYKNYKSLIKYIIDNTNSNIALIPHVVWDDNNDLQPLTRLYNEYKDTNRLCLIDQEQKLNCMELKYIISKCRFMVVARTHASIAAYSTCVPTLVVGYSVKAMGIAKDIFGTYENYVLPVQSLVNETDLINSFKYLQQNEDSIKTYLNEFMPRYIEMAYTPLDIVRELMDVKHEN